ncbi:AraC family transcriptional regulator [Sorangium sp. So ce542]
MRSTATPSPSAVGCRGGSVGRWRERIVDWRPLRVWTRSATPTLDEGTSFQQILKETREALARHYLEKTSLPVAEISFLLGFSEPNSFYRAFRSWTGTTPDQARRAV